MRGVIQTKILVSVVLTLLGGLGFLSIIQQVMRGVSPPCKPGEIGYKCPIPPNISLKAEWVEPDICWVDFRNSKPSRKGDATIKNEITIDGKINKDCRDINQSHIVLSQKSIQCGYYWKPALNLNLGEWKEDYFNLSFYLDPTHLDTEVSSVQIKGEVGKHAYLWETTCDPEGKFPYNTCNPCLIPGIFCANWVNWCCGWNSSRIKRCEISCSCNTPWYCFRHFSQVAECCHGEYTNDSVCNIEFKDEDLEHGIRVPFGVFKNDYFKFGWCGGFKDCLLCYKDENDPTTTYWYLCDVNISVKSFSVSGTLIEKAGGEEYTCYYHYNFPTGVKYVPLGGKVGKWVCDWGGWREIVIEEWEEW